MTSQISPTLGSRVLLNLRLLFRAVVRLFLIEPIHRRLFEQLRLPEIVLPGHWIGLQANSVFVVTGHLPFIVNLSKSLLILWLMTLLVIIIAILCSTFLSWPIAVVLTIVILLGRWGVMQLGDSLGSGIGNQIATDFGFSDPSQAKVVSSGVEALTKALTTVSRVLPDISKFSATEDVERGVVVPTARLTESSAVAFGFGLPMIVLAYIFLKNKEVAP